MNDLELLQKYEPILRFTHGELFFPTRVDEYVARSSLWVRSAQGTSNQVAKSGDLDLKALAEVGAAAPGERYYLRFVQQPLDRFDYQRWHRRPGRPVFQAPGRLARVGLPARLTDSVFSLSLLLRGTVPGGTAAAAAMQYEAFRRKDPSFYYYGRVLRENGYIVLHYLYFYAMNDWRSTFAGANDHEADWEQVFIYLDGTDPSSPKPAWLAYATHNDFGDNLRRRWDDPEIDKIGTHPVVYVGAGSHASYFEAGEYLTLVELAFVTPVLSVVHGAERVWREWLGQGDPEKLVARIENFLGVPFIDYARGDGLSVGPGQDESWCPLVLDGDEAWVNEYRGLWGLDAHDPFAGESAPGGPKYNPDGTVRQSWFDPLGWAGLNKVAPPSQADDELERHMDELRESIEATRAEIDHLTTSLPRLELEVRALQLGRQWTEIHERRSEELQLGVERLNDLQRRQVELEESRQSSEEFLARLRQGDFGDPQSHITHKVRPQSEQELRASRLAEMWAAISVGVLMLGIVAAVALDFAGWALTIAFIAGMVLLIESILRQKVINLVVNVTIVLALFTSAILVYEFFWWLIVIGTVAVALLIITDNIRELRGM